MLVSSNDYSSINSLIACMSDTSLWMQNFLQLNQEKAEILVTGAKAEREKLSEHINLLRLITKEQVKNLSVTDSDLNFEQHVRNVSKVSFYHLRNISSQKVSITERHGKVNMCFFMDGMLMSSCSFYYGINMAFELNEM